MHESNLLIDAKRFYNSNLGRTISLKRPYLSMNALNYVANAIMLPRNARTPLFACTKKMYETSESVLSCRETLVIPLQYEQKNAERTWHETGSKYWCGKRV